MSSRVLVTGAHGFVGKHVFRAFEAGSFGDAVAIAPPPGWDLRDVDAVNAVVSDARPDAVIHLAAQSFVPRSFQDPEETFQINLLGTLHLLQALKRVDFSGRLLYVSSGDVYGRVPDEALPVDEHRLPEPRSPYAVSKWAAEQLCLQWSRTEGLDCVVARPFNHIGPGQDRRFVLPALARQVVDIALGEQAPVIEAGDVDTTRDFTDVRDVVSAYAAMLSRGVSGRVYLVASGKEMRVRDLLGMMCRAAGIDPVVHQDPARIRPAEQRRMVASAQLLSADTGWAPSYSIESTITDILKDATNNI